MTGNCISNIIETKDKDTNTYNKDLYRFYSLSTHDNVVDTMNSFFMTSFMSSSILLNEPGKYHIDVLTKNNDRIRVQFFIQKLNSRGKLIYSISYKKVIELLIKGNNFEFQSLVRTFFENFKNIFIPF